MGDSKLIYLNLSILRKIDFGNSEAWVIAGKDMVWSMPRLRMVSLFPGFLLRGFTKTQSPTDYCLGAAFWSSIFCIFAVLAECTWQSSLVQQTVTILAPPCSQRCLLSGVKWGLITVNNIVQIVSTRAPLHQHIFIHKQIK